MDRYAQLKEKLKNRERVSMANMMLAQSPFMIDACAEADCVLLDKEHGLYGTEELVPLTMRCRMKSLPAVVRVEDSLYHLIAKSIDLGADGIMLPRTETAEQVKTAVEAMHLHPVGRTGWGGWGLRREGESVEEFQTGRLLFPQIESPRGLANMEEMIERYGAYIDGFIIGPNDYSVMLGIPKQLDHPLMLEHIQKVFDISIKHGFSCGCFAGDPAHVERYARMGANIFWVGSDSDYMRRGLREYLRCIADGQQES